MAQQDTIRCGSCHFDSDSTNVKGESVYCTSCGDVIPEEVVTKQETVDRLRTRPFAAVLAGLRIGGAQ